MYRSTQRQAPRRAPARTAPRRSLPGGRPPRPGRPSRRSGPNLGPVIALALVVIALAAAGFFFWQSRQRAPAETAEAAAAATFAMAGTPAASSREDQAPEATATATLPVISTGSIPGGGDAAVPAAATSQAGNQPQAAGPTPGVTAGAASPAPTVVSAATQAATPRSPAASAATATRPKPATRAPTAAAAGATAPSAPTRTPAAAASASQQPAGGPDIAALAQRLLEIVNADRAANGLRPVAWDATAAAAGQRHSEEMAQFGYMSHWNMDGYGPEYRYSRAGGLDMSQENVYRLVHQWEDGRGAPIDDWEKTITDAEDAWMHSPGHRANILAPEHTHLGIGIAYNPATGNVAMAQEFVNRYVTIEPLPRRAQPGDRLVLRGTLLPGSTDPLVNLSYEPFPAPMTLEQLNKTGSYKSAAQHLSVPQVRTDANGRFVSEFTIAKDAPPGLYHVWLWVKSPASAERVQAVDAIVEVSQ